MTGSPPTALPPGFLRFVHGSLECTVVTDGIVTLGPARESFPNADRGDLDALLSRHYLPTDVTHFDQNVLVVNVSGTLVMFDTGVGTDPELGVKNFGGHTGLTIPNLRLAGIEPEEIDIIALTHAHPDHAWGLVDAAGRRLYPNATVAVGRADYEWWTDLSRVPAQPSEHQKDQIRGAHKNLTAYDDALLLLEGGEELVPGIRSVRTAGHTPGHMVYEITSGAETMICWGDLCHHQVLLLEHPEWNFIFDWDQALATSERIRIYDLVDEQRHWVFGYHFPFPGLGHLRRDESAFTWLPANPPRALPEAAP